MEPWKAIIDGWLEADRGVPRKQRHTARRVWQRLVDEHQATVGESTVRRYVAEARRRHPTALAEVMVPQWHPLGAEAEVDFGSVTFWVGGVETGGWMFVMRLSASGRGFHRVQREVRLLARGDRNHHCFAYRACNPEHVGRNDA